MRKIQQLAYDGKRLLCPDHPDSQLVESSTLAGRFAVLCSAPIPGTSLNCMNSAEWPTRADMLHEITSST